MTDIEFAELFEKASMEAIRKHPNDFEARVQIAKSLHAAGVRAALAIARRIPGLEANDIAEEIERELLGLQNAPAGAQSGGS